MAKGWYPDPQTAGIERYWDGIDWTTLQRESRQHFPDADWAPESAAKYQAQDRGDREVAKPGVAFGILILGLVGWFLSSQSTSLMEGTGKIWLGVAVAAVALTLTFILKGGVWLKVVAGLLAFIALFNGVSMEDQLSDRRGEISDMLNP